jgi:hypothetical protein
MSELKSFIDDTFNNLKLKIEEEYNNKIKEHFTKISIDVCNDSYSKEEYGKIDIGKIKHPEGRYIIHQIEFDKEIDSLLIGGNRNNRYNIKKSKICKHLDQLIYSGTILFDNFGERYVFLQVLVPYGNGGTCTKYQSCSPNTKYPNGYRSDLSSNEILFNMEFQLIPSKNEYEYPLTNKIIDFVKTQNFPIDNLNILSKIMASIEIFKNKESINEDLLELDPKNKELVNSELLKLDPKNKELVNNELLDFKNKKLVYEDDINKIIIDNETNQNIIKNSM